MAVKSVLKQGLRQKLGCRHPTAINTHPLSANAAGKTERSHVVALFFRLVARRQAILGSVEQPAYSLALYLRPNENAKAEAFWLAPPPLFVSSLSNLRATTQSKAPATATEAISTIMLGKRYAAEISNQMEACLTEFYRQECLRSLYKKQVRRDLWEYPMQHHSTSKKGVSFAVTPEIIGCADPSVDRSPIDVSPISQFELMLLLSQRQFPVQAA